MKPQNNTVLYIILGVVVLIIIGILVYFLILKKDPSGTPSGGPVSAPVPSGTPSGGPVSAPVPSGTPSGGPVSAPVPSRTPNRVPVPSGTPGPPILSIINRGVAHVRLGIKLPVSAPATGTVNIVNTDNSVRSTHNVRTDNGLQSNTGLLVTFFSTAITVPDEYKAKLTVDGVSYEAPFIINFGKPVVTVQSENSVSVRADTYQVPVTGECDIVVIHKNGQTFTVRANISDLPNGVTVQVTDDTFLGTEPYYVVIYPVNNQTLVNSESSAVFRFLITPGPGPI